MAKITREKLNIVTDGSSNSTQVTSGVYSGFVHAVRFELGTASSISTAATFTITGEDSHLDILVDSNTSAAHTVYPRTVIHTTGAAALALSSGQWDRIPIADERIKVVFASGGASKFGSLIFMIEGA